MYTFKLGFRLSCLRSRGGQGSALSAHGPLHRPQDSPQGGVTQSAQCVHPLTHEKGRWRGAMLVSITVSASSLTRIPLLADR